MIEPAAFPPAERRSPARVKDHAIWLEHNALLQHVGLLEAAGDAMARIMASIDKDLPSVKTWNNLRKGA